MSHTTAGNPSAIGDVLDGRYRIDHPIARGGMSTVYRCVDERLGRAVAAKVMAERYQEDPVFLNRFKREARAMAQLNHPNLVNVYDFSTSGDDVFLIMELITGGTLRELLAERGPMPPHAATAVMRAVLTGLSVIHARGLVHRDIKPDNVLINGDHRVKLADFGLIRATSASTHSTDSIVGTVSYISPEQVSGEDITPASDVYSAGVVFFELLTGTTPFSGDTPLAHAMARLENDVPAPSSRIEGVPKLFDALVASATARDPEERFPDAGQFLAALDDVAAELELPAFTVPIPRNSAAARTAAVPTDLPPLGENTTELHTAPQDESTTVLPPAQPPLHETRVLSFQEPEPEPEPEPVPEPDPVREPQWEPRPERQTAYRPDNRETHMFPAADSRAVPQQPVPAPIPAPAPAPAPAPMSAWAPEPAPARSATTEPPEKVLSNRSGVKFLLFLILVAVIVGAVAVAAWWFGSGAYGQYPRLF